MRSTSSNTKSRKTKNSGLPRPFVTANFALTLDARVTTRRRAPSGFSSPADKRRLVEIRADTDAILVGRTTAETDAMGLGIPDEKLRATRVRAGKPACPLRVLVSNSGRIKPSLKLFRAEGGPVVIYSTQRMPARTRAALEKRATLFLTMSDVVQLPAMLVHLHLIHGVRRLVCEGGPTLFRGLLAADLVDEIHLTLCPRVFGGKDAPTLTGVAGDFLPRTLSCRLVEMKTVGDECFLRYRVLHNRRTEPRFT
jgi:riboflavin-specific deaminase-like protein